MYVDGKYIVYEIGDVVKITDFSKTFVTYTRLFIEFGFNNRRINYAWNNGTYGTIFAMDGFGVVALRDEIGRECLIGIDGIRPISIVLNFKYGKI